MMANRKTGNSTINTKEDNLPNVRPDRWYVTDWQTIDFAFQRWLDLFGSEIHKDKIFHRYPFQVLDICAGTGRWGRVFNHRLKTYTNEVATRFLEINPLFNPFLQPHAVEIFNEDILKKHLLTGYTFDLVVGNPDFNIFRKSNVKRYFQNMLDLIDGGGWLILFMGSSAPFSDIRSFMYEDFGLGLRHIEVLSRRVSFNPIFHPQAGETGANDHVILYFKRADRKTLPTTMGGKNPPGRDTLLFNLHHKTQNDTKRWRHKDTFLHQLPFGLWDFEFVERNAKGKIIKKDGKPIPSKWLYTQGLAIEKGEKGYTILPRSLTEAYSHDLDKHSFFESYKIPTIPEWIWDTIS